MIIYAEVIELDLRLSPSSATGGSDASTIALDLRLSGSALSATYISTNNTISIALRLNADVVIEAIRNNWVGWGKIGEASFVLDLVNDAGFRPMEWAGFVFAVKKLGDRVIVYGTNGISMMYPVSVPFATFGFKEVSPIGLKAKNSVCGTDEVHYFIDGTNCLYKFTPTTLDKLDYVEYLSTLVNPSMFYDQYFKRAIISDSTHGYVYTDSGLGGGYGNLSGYEYVDRLVRVSSPGTIDTPPLELSTDIIDFGRRGLKTIESVQVGTDTTATLYLAIEYRNSYKEAFKSTRWTQLNTEGIGYTRCSGSEFRVKVKLLQRALLGIDYINIQFKTTDQRFSRSALVPQIQGSAFAGTTRGGRE